MKIELIVIGDEVLNGFTVNTNAAFIGQELLKKGYSLSQHSVFPDQVQVLQVGFKQALERSDLVITTGGLGPTVDDLTREVSARLFDSKFIYSEKVAKDIKKRFENEPSVVEDTLKDQATVPENAAILLNPVGTAPGFIFEKGRKALIMLPGVPNELHPMFLEQALPFITSHFPLKKKHYRRVIHLFEIKEHVVDPFLRDLDKKYENINLSIYPSLGTLSVHVSTEADNEEQAMEMLDPAFSAIEREFAANCFQSQSGKIEEAVHHLFQENQWTLSLAESCTGGRVAAKLTALPGASQYFLGSVVCYANSLKNVVLGIPEADLIEHGAVSKTVVEQMAVNVCHLTKSDFSLAVSGIAGPNGGEAKKPVGTVWCAVYRQGTSPKTWKLELSGTREMILRRSVVSLFSHLLLYTKETSLL